MKTAVCELESVSPFQFSRYYSKADIPPKPKESDNDYEHRTWFNRAHFDEKGMVFIPPMMFKKSLEEAAQYLSMKVQGKGQATWTKHFLAGVLVVDPLPVGVHVEKVEKLSLFVPSNGKKGGGKRVNRVFPILRQWKGAVTYLIFDDSITEDVFRTHLDHAGSLIGIGAFRPRNGGYFGRYKVNSVKWAEDA